MTLELILPPNECIQRYMGLLTQCSFEIRSKRGGLVRLLWTNERHISTPQYLLLRSALLGTNFPFLKAGSFAWSFFLQIAPEIGGNVGQQVPVEDEADDIGETESDRWCRYKNCSISECSDPEFWQELNHIELSSSSSEHETDTNPNPVWKCLKVITLAIVLLQAGYFQGSTDVGIMPQMRQMKSCTLRCTTRWVCVWLTWAMAMPFLHLTKLVGGFLIPSSWDLTHFHLDFWGIC